VVTEKDYHWVEAKSEAKMQSRNLFKEEDESSSTFVKIDNFKKAAKTLDLTYHLKDHPTADALLTSPPLRRGERRDIVSPIFLGPYKGSPLPLCSTFDMYGQRRPGSPTASIMALWQNDRAIRSIPCFLS
jgi:hypothetical protein